MAGRQLDSKNYVVLLGNVGSGKSTIVEKLTGEEKRSSDRSESFTATSEVFAVPDKSLAICDTPGSNAKADTFKHNVWIAAAMNYMPVSKILIVIKAATRIENVVDAVNEYAERFIDMDEDLLGVIVTHMDQVTWDKEKCLDQLKKYLGIEEAIFSRKNTSSQDLLKDITSICRRSHDISVTDENFLKLFKINDKKLKIVRTTKKQVDDFRALRDAFYTEKEEFQTRPKDLVDLVFEFQAWMHERITQAQIQVSEENEFTFMGDSCANEVGHVANMTNQLAALLKDLRTDVLGYQQDHGVNELRKCPFCALIWAKIQGCNGSTTCGAIPTQLEVRSMDFCVLGTFTFYWNGKKLTISKSGEKQVEGAAKEQKGFESIQQRPNREVQRMSEVFQRFLGLASFETRNCKNSVGCGKTINWKEMVKVETPTAFFENVVVNVDDVKLVPQMAIPNWTKTYNAATEDIHITEKQC